MDTNGQITMLVRWVDQRRPIKVNINDDLNTIEKTINDSYQLQQANDLREYQIQYYNSDYQHFTDLYPGTFDTFQQLLQKLSSPEAPPKSAKEWLLKIVPKTVQNVQPIRHPIHESITTDDTYNYQQENDPSNLHEIEEPITINLRSSAHPDASSTDNLETLPRDPLAQNTDEGEQVTVQPQILITTDHSYGLRFDVDLAGQQRQQYEKDMCRTSSSKSSKGGVRLRACSKSDGTASSDKSYPVVHFQIPSDKHHLEWYLVLSILTEADNNGAHYLHSSKGIYHGETTREIRCGGIRDSESVNPYVFRLTPNQLRDGVVEILIKVCNMRDLPTRKKEKLREFSRLANPKNYDQLTLSSTNTMHDLKFTNEKYHLGCTLICGEMIHDQCISNLTTAVSNQKRNNNDSTSPQGSASKKEKK